MEINGDLLSLAIEYQAGVIAALLPLIAAVIGTFLAFAIAHSLRFFIQRMLKR
jgi:hypothetical protein